MVAFDPPRVMELRWGDDVLRFEIDAHGAASVLTLTVTFEELGKVARDGAGWHAGRDLLGCEVAGQVAPWTSAERWKEVHDTYVERFGAEASTLGPPLSNGSRCMAPEGVPHAPGERITRLRAPPPP